MPSLQPSRTPRPFRWQPPALDPLGRWAAALALFLAVLACQLELRAAGQAFPLLAFFPAVLLAAWISRGVPALVMTLAAAAASWWFLIRPPGTLAWPSALDAAALAFFLAVGGFAVALVTGLARSAEVAVAERDAARAALAAEQTKTAELHHRIANTLQLVASAVMLRTRASDGDQASALTDTLRRLDALGRLHRRLVSASPASDPLELLAELSRTQLEACGTGRITLELDVQPDLRIDPSRIATLAMILSEGLSNALKHAFPQNRPGRLQVRLRSTEPERMELEIRDDGIGLPGDFDAAARHSPGLSIMRSLARQMDGRLTLASDTRGTVLRVVFPASGSAQGA